MAQEELPENVASNVMLGLVPAAHVRWREQNGWDVTEFTGLRGHPEIEAFWGNRKKLALYTANQVRAAVDAERERFRLLLMSHRDNTVISHHVSLAECHAARNALQLVIDELA